MQTAERIFSAAQVVTLGVDPRPRRGEGMGEIGVIIDGALAVREGRIVGVGSRFELERRFQGVKRSHFPDACLTPGLIDPHTHLVFAGTRERDFYERIAGVSYEEIAKRGGGIRESVRHLRQASAEDLLAGSRKRLRQVLSHGTTTCEVKSGYGLNLTDEVKTLTAVQTLNQEQPVTLIPTFLGAHEVPDEYRQNRGAYVRLLQDEILPKIAGERLARFCDIFCEKDVFSVEESREILATAKKLGLQLKLHADELSENFGGAELAAELAATSADHLVMISAKGIQALAQAGTVAVLLPATTFFLGKDRYAPARKMIEAGVPVALATDLNPGSSNTESMQAVMTLAALKLKMTPEEILTAVTHNAACAIAQEERVGRLAEDLFADFVVWDLPDYRCIPYHFGGNRVLEVFKHGQSVWRSPV